MDPINLHEGDAIKNAKDLNRSERRSLMLHLLYTMEMNDYQISLESLLYQYDCAFHFVIDPEDPLVLDAKAIIAYRDQADEIVKPLLEHWKFERVSVMTRLILRYAFWELNVKQADAALVINEAIELAKGFGESDSYRFVHGVLDSWVKRS